MLLPGERGFDEPGASPHLRRVCLEDLCVCLMRAHLTPVSVNSHVAAVERLLDEALAVYATPEVKLALGRALAKERVLQDRTGRLIPQRIGSSTLETARAFAEARMLAEAVSEAPGR